MRNRLGRYGDVIAESALLVLVLGVPLAIGGVHKPTIWFSALLSCLACTAIIFYRTWRKSPLRVPFWAVVLLGLCVINIVQLIPVPMRVLGWLAPATADTLGVSLADVGVPRWHSISLDPGATAWEVLKMGACALTFIAAVNFFHRAERRYRLCWALVCVGCAVTVLGLVGAVVAPGKPLLFYQPMATVYAAGLLTTSFVNPNHGAAFLNLCMLLALGLAMKQSQAALRWLYFGAAALLGLGVCLTLSRGGIAALGMGVVLLGALTLLRRRNSAYDEEDDLGDGAKAGTGAPATARSLYPLALAGLGAVIGLASLLAFDPIMAEFFPAEPLAPKPEKTGLWPAGLRMLSDHAWVGVGRGAFASVFPRYLGPEMPLNISYTHLENQFLHVPIEWGLPVAAALFAAALIVGWRWLRGALSDPLALSAAVALLMLVLHNIVDFSFELLGIAIPCAALAGMLAAIPPTRSMTKRESTPSPSTPRWLSGRGARVWTVSVANAVLVVALIGVAWMRPQDVLAHQQQLVQLERQGAKPQAIRHAVQLAVKKHPAAYGPHLILGRLHLAQGDRKAIVHFNRALYLFPLSPKIHLDAAEALLKFGHRSQALLEFRLALQNHAPVEPTLKKGLLWIKSTEDLWRLLPEQSMAYTSAATILLSRNKNKLARAVTERALTMWPHEHDVMAIALRAQVSTGDSKAAVARAEAYAKKRQDVAGFITWAHIAQQASDLPSAERAFAMARRQFPHEVSLLTGLAYVYLRQKRLDEAKTIAETAFSQGTGPVALANIHDLLGEIHHAMGNAHRAQYERDQAAQLRQVSAH